MEKTMDKIVALCNSRGFIHPGSQIYKKSMVAEIRAGKS